MMDHSAILLIIGIFVSMVCLVIWILGVYLGIRMAFWGCRSIVVEYVAPFEDPNNKIWVLINKMRI